MTVTKFTAIAQESPAVVGVIPFVAIAELIAQMFTLLKNCKPTEAKQAAKFQKLCAANDKRMRKGKDSKCPLELRPAFKAVNILDRDKQDDGWCQLASLASHQPASVWEA